MPNTLSTMRSVQAAIRVCRKANLETIGEKRKMKKYMLPVIAALIIALLVVPIMPVNAATPSTSGYATVVTIPEDDLKRETGVMVLGLTPTVNTLLPTFPNAWYTDSMCTALVPAAGITVGPELTDEPILYPMLGTVAAPVLYYQRVSNTLCVAHSFAPLWPNDKGYQPGWDLISQHKMLATLNGYPTKPDYLLCEVVEKEKAKIPPQGTKSLSKRQFADENIKTTLQDVTDNFVCKFHTIKAGVYALDVYFVGPHVSNFIADHMLIVTVGYKVGRNTIWASDLQDICILGWSMGTNAMAIGLFPPYTLSQGYYLEIYWSWDDALGKFVSCDEAAAWQLAWITGGWPYSTN
jgi:hypothetical protein